MSLLKRLSAAAAVFASLAVSLPAAHAESRTALVIGNAGYAFGKLENPVNDARDMADALRGSGFEVILKTDADQATMKDAIRAFSNAMRNKGGIGLLYFSGHGVQANGENYLLPLGEKPASEAALKAGGVTAAEAVDAMAAARNALNIVILDACRDNPLADRRRTRGCPASIPVPICSSRLLLRRARSHSTAAGATALTPSI